MYEMVIQIRAHGRRWWCVIITIITTVVIAMDFSVCHSEGRGCHEINLK